MFSFSKDKHSTFLAEKNLSVLDGDFFNNLNETTKSLIIGENGAGKTRFLQTIESFYREKINQNAEDIILFPIFCTDLNISSPETVSQNGINFQNNDVIQGTVWQKEPKDKILEINKQVLWDLIQQAIIMPPEETMEKTLKLINLNLNNLLNKKLDININHGKRELTITRYESNKKKAVPLMEEWNYLSPGERIIFILLLLVQYLDRMKEHLDAKEIIILIDEPELHLHPKVLIELIINRLLKYFPWKKEKNTEINGHVFIASHSVFLIPYFEFEEHIYLKEGDILRKNGSLYKSLYRDLIGLENGQNDGGPNLFDFLGSVHDWDYYSFIAECFKEPETVEKEDAKDKQTVILLDKIIYNEIKKKGTITVLDYGCGPVARIGQNIKANEKTEKLQKQINYFAFDKYCYDRLNQYLTKKELPFLGGIINNIDEFKNKKNTFDIILLFNVLHEIDVAEWEDEINLLLELLKDDGLLVFSEKKYLSKGEDPYGKSGYLVFSDKELKKLFNLENIQKVSEEDDPVVTSVIRKNQDIRNIIANNIFEALKELEKNTEEMVFSVLNKKIKFPSRKYAFCCQQYINARHALKLMTERNNKFEIPAYFENWNLPLILEMEDKDKRYWLLNQRVLYCDDEIARECRKYLEIYINGGK
jgi:energy-coupling factor transporter ATP-binding protein EcfA2